jgi:hypothetical protein
MIPFVLGQICAECSIYPSYKVAIVNPKEPEYIFRLANDRVEDNINIDIDKASYRISFPYSNSFIQILKVTNLESSWIYAGYEFEKIYFDEYVTIADDNLDTVHLDGTGIITREAYLYISTLARSHMYQTEVVVLK